MFALDLGHELADHFVVKVFFTQGVLSCRLDANNPILYREERHKNGHLPGKRSDYFFGINLLAQATWQWQLAY